MLFGHGCEPSASCAARQRWRCGRPSACACASCANETLAVFPLPCHPIAAEVLPRDPWPEKRSPSARHPFLIETLPNGQIRKSELINWGLAQKRRAQRITRGRRHLAGSGSVASEGREQSGGKDAIHSPAMLSLAASATCGSVCPRGCHRHHQHRGAVRWWSIRRVGGWRHGDFLLGMALGNSPLVLMRLSHCVS